jgi:hypothetical protein
MAGNSQAHNLRPCGLSRYSRASTAPGCPHWCAATPLPRRATVAFTLTNAARRTIAPAAWRINLVACVSNRRLYCRAEPDHGHRRLGRPALQDHGRRAGARREDQAAILLQAIARRAGAGDDRPGRPVRQAAGGRGWRDRAGGGRRIRRSTSSARPPSSRSTRDRRAGQDCGPERSAEKWNARYRQYRLAQVEKREPAIPYSVFSRAIRHHADRARRRDERADDLGAAAGPIITCRLGCWYRSWYQRSHRQKNINSINLLQANCDTGQGTTLRPCGLRVAQPRKTERAKRVRRSRAKRERRRTSPFCGFGRRANHGSIMRSDSNFKQP